MCVVISQCDEIFCNYINASGAFNEFVQYPHGGSVVMPKQCLECCEVSWFFIKAQLLNILHCGKLIVLLKYGTIWVLLGLNAAMIEFVHFVGMVTGTMTAWSTKLLSASSNFGLSVNAMHLGGCCTVWIVGSSLIVYSPSRRPTPEHQYSPLVLVMKVKIQFVQLVRVDELFSDEWETFKWNNMKYYLVLLHLIINTYNPSVIIRKGPSQLVRLIRVMQLGCT